MAKLFFSLLLLSSSVFAMERSTTPDTSNCVNDGGCSQAMDMTSSSDSGSYSVDMEISHDDAMSCADMYTPTDTQIPDAK